ncbi:MAG TPA: aromatic ring-hydroxylating dioxygenase subunit alpha [Sphingobium sp.]|uniref:aromatic ring-hydroxylating oxygenase subunit alpha n=1 Tax=Sphingobium sp. TaxID=1912891 RepID=UPI002ED2E5D2
MGFSANVENDLPGINAEDYISRDFLDQEKRKLWPKVWQIACREEEIAHPGEFVTYDIGDDSIIVTRTKSGEILAYHNVCPHRGRRLASGCGKANQFRCSYHGWRFDLEGRNVYVQDPHDWGGELGEADIDLRRVRVGTWGGFVFIDMRAEGESLTDYLETVPDYLDPYEYEHMRYRWYLTLHLDCNWKVALEAFIENYHVATTHPQILPFVGDDYSQSYAQGKHAHFGFWETKTPLGYPSPRLKRQPPEDERVGVIDFFRTYEEQLKAMFSERDYKAAQGLMDVLPKGAPPGSAFFTAVELGRKAAEAEGIGYPEGATFEQMAKAGANWHIFPNCATLPWFDGALFYRARPDGDDPDKCVFDIWSLVRYAPGTEPPLERVVYTSMEGNSAGQILDQDIANMAEVQKGMKSRAFRRALVNPVQEMEIINFHHHLRRYLELE